MHFNYVCNRNEIHVCWIFVKNICLNHQTNIFLGSGLNVIEIWSQVINKNGVYTQYCSVYFFIFEISPFHDTFRSPKDNDLLLSIEMCLLLNEKNSLKFRILPQTSYEICNLRCFNLQHCGLFYIVLKTL